MEKRIELPLTAEKVKDLKVGESVLISGTIYTARDAAHKRLVELLDKGEKLPMDLTDSIIYYAGPAPAKPGQALGSVGPTTAYRMDAYAPRLMDDAGLKGMIGKGLRSPEVVDAMKRNTCVYFGAIGGAGALISKSVKKAEIVCYEDLGAEAVRRIVVEDFPAVVVIDHEGNNLYEIGKAEYLESAK